MNKEDRREVLGCLDEAWRRAAAGDIQPAERNVSRALELLESTIAWGGEPAIVVTMVHRRVEEGRAAIAERDLLGAMLAAIAALDFIQPRLETTAENFDIGSQAPPVRRSQAV